MSQNWRLVEALQLALKICSGWSLSMGVTHYTKNAFFRLPNLLSGVLRSYYYLMPTSRRDAGVVDRDGLENRCTSNCTQGSNPCLSANLRRKKPQKVPFGAFIFQEFLYIEP